MPISDIFNQASSLLKVEDLTSQCNGSRQVFTISEAFNSSSLRVYWNGIRQTTTEIVVESSFTFSTSFTPATGAPLVVEFYTL